MENRPRANTSNIIVVYSIINIDGDERYGSRQERMVCVGQASKGSDVWLYLNI